jgi:AcrR family transcriptional regulator
MARKIGSHGAATAILVRAKAIQLIAEHGYEAMSLRQLATECDMQSGSIYHYFSSKQDLLVTLLMENMQQLLAAWSTAKSRSPDAVEQLLSFVSFHIHYHTQYKLEAFISDMELRSLQPAEKIRVVELRKQYEEELSRILVLGVEQQQFHIQEIQAVTFAILSMLTGVYMWYQQNGRLSEAELIEIYSNLVLKSLK